MTGHVALAAALAMAAARIRSPIRLIVGDGLKTVPYLLEAAAVTHVSRVSFAATETSSRRCAPLVRLNSPDGVKGMSAVRRNSGGPMSRAARLVLVGLFVVVVCRAAAAGAQTTAPPEGWVVLPVDEYRALRERANPPALLPQASSSRKPTFPSLERTAPSTRSRLSSSAVGFTGRRETRSWMAMPSRDVYVLDRPPPRSRRAKYANSSTTGATFLPDSWLKIAATSRLSCSTSSQTGMKKPKKNSNKR